MAEDNSGRFAIAVDATVLRKLNLICEVLGTSKQDVIGAFVDKYVAEKVQTAEYKKAKEEFIKSL
jgi:hypothetical protein